MEIVIDFDKNEKKPERIFESAALLIKSLNTFDKSLSKTISSKIEPDMMLENVQEGSLRIILKQVIESIDDSGLANCDIKKIIGKYLINAKYLFLKFLSNEDNLENPIKIEQLRTDIFELTDKAEEQNILPVYNKINTSDLISNISMMHDAVSVLSKNDKLKFLINNKGFSINFKKQFSIENFEEILGQKKIETVQNMILKVRKPDYLGDSQWDFRHGKNTFSAKITDLEWVKKFQNREIDIRPKDSIECDVKILSIYDSENELLTAKYEILKVHNVKSFFKEQGKLF